MSARHVWISDADESSLHASRLLGIEQRPFLRVFKRLTQPDTPLLRENHRLPTPPSDTERAASTESSDLAEDKESAEQFTARRERETQQWRDDMLLDFAALESSMVRIQLLQQSNERERERYAKEKVQIMETAEGIRRTNAELKIQLEQARQTMEDRKKYDEFANKIFGNKLLKSRDEQMQMHEKLQKEIAEQEAEAEEYARQVESRRELWFGTVKASLKSMKAIQHPELVKQEEAEQDVEGEVEEEAEDTHREGSAPPSPSLSNTREGTPTVAEIGEEGGSEPLKVSAPSRVPSQAGTPAPEVQDVEDVVMDGDAPTPMESAEEGEATDDDLMED